MKTKLFYFLVASLFVLSSCSSDTDGRDIEPITKTEPIIDPKPESNPIIDNQILVKKIISTDEKGLVTTILYNYDGNKIVSKLYNDTKPGMYYTYSGDLITKLEYKFADGTIDQIDTYKYDGDKKIIEFFSTQPGQEKWDHYEFYVYNADGTVSVYSEDGFKYSTITFLNGEVSEIVSTNSPNFKYTYDTKNNPEKNILGMDKIAFTYGEASGVLRNIISETYGYGNDAKTTTLKITYNADGYPVKSFDNFEDTGTTKEYFY
jgi:hypothetical protein